ncbi:hypothetical protein TWF679_000907 [Orbilia oligospora]|uniref:Mannose-1-phosphate guanyltransferase n=1 Tax=Orbilia oligospora TaxID=2813651 RepID=A0A8H8VHJ2_ORBOL|nr:hypothetical protein TWF679_000907 [Orbilia oligospora]
MAPTSKRGSAKKTGVLEEAPEALLQAVIIADSFNRRFRPITLEKPRCLLPLANTPIIEYTLEFLALGGVEEILLYCHAHHDQITEYIRESKWSKESSPFQIRVIYSPSIMSVGDVMRELDQSRLIKEDFILVSGDIVSNIPLQGILKEHKARRLADKNCIMTSVLREISPRHDSRPRGENALFILDQNRERILHYEYLKQSDSESPMLLPRELGKAFPTMSFQENFLDCCIDIVSFEVPPLFTENFDWQHSRKDFLHGILMDELYGKTVYAHILKSGYAGRIQSLQTYDAILHDITRKWTHPFSPDTNLNQQTYKYTRGHIYKESKVILAQSAVIKDNSIIGSGTSVGVKTIISGATIGRNCIIGKNVELHSTIVWDNVVIGDNCSLGNCIIANEAHIGDGCTVESGAIISFGVTIEKGTNIPTTARYTKMSTKKEKESGRFTQVVHSKTKSLIEYEDSEDDEDEQRETSMGSLYAPEDESDYSDISDFEDDDEIPGKRKKGHARTSSESEADSFFREAYNSLLGALKQSHSVDIMILELNGLRMSANAEFSEVRRATAAAIISYIVSKITSNENTSKVVDATVEKLLPLFNRMIFEVNDQAELLGYIQRELAGKERGGTLMQAIGMKLYNEDLCDDEGLLKWWNEGNGPQGETPEMAKVRDGAKAFVKWVEEQDEDSEDSEEEEESEEEDDE